MSRPFTPLTATTSIPTEALNLLAPVLPRGVPISDWIDRVTQTWRPPGLLLHTESTPSAQGLLVGAPAGFFQLNCSPRPSSPDVVWLALLWPEPGGPDQAWGRSLIQAWLAELTSCPTARHGVEALGGRHGLPEKVLLETGFRLARRGLTDSRFRLDLGATVRVTQPRHHRRWQWLAPLPPARPSPAGRA